MSEKLYAGLEERDPMALDEAGDFYTKHVMAMTGERLHSKADIAAELGYRDMRIAELESQLREQRELMQAVVGSCSTTTVITLADKKPRELRTGFVSIDALDAIAAHLKEEK